MADNEEYWPDNDGALNYLSVKFVSSKTLLTMIPSL